MVEVAIDRELSVGDYVLSGGELPALVMIDALARLLPGALGDERSNVEDSFVQGLLDWPHYTRPESFEGHSVPPVLSVRRPRADPPLAARAGVHPHGGAPARHAVAGETRARDAARFG